jgi:hypothetical protein
VRRSRSAWARCSSEAFLRGIERLSHERGRDGAYAWSLFEDAADRLLQQQIESLLKGSPITTHLVAARLDNP